MQEQKAEESERDFNRAVEIDPENTDVLHHRGQVSLSVFLILTVQIYSENENITSAIFFI